ncbi:MAG: glycosyltransferase family 4 protein [Gammaproteobacteria bacterium]|nr:glycosyltransferase family 4 protein [Gammaproteobacteria bacterium]
MKVDPIYIVLPPGEMFSKCNAGAVAIVIHSMCEKSIFNAQILGEDCREPFSDTVFHPIKPFLYRFRRRSRAYASSCSSFLRRQAPGIVEIHNRIPLFLSLEKKLKQHVYCLYLHNDPQGMKGAKSSHERQVLIEKSAAIYVVSDYIKQRFMEGLSYGEHKIHVIHNGVACDQKVAISLKRQHIIFVGRIIPEKGVLEFAKALNILLPRNPEWKAIFIGARHFGNTEPTTAYEREVLFELKALGQKVEYKNAIPHQEVMANYEVADIAVVPSIWNEPFGRTALEAMASHCALVSSDRGGLAEVIPDTALIINPEDPSSIVTAVQKMIDEPWYRDELRQHAYNRVTRLFCQSKIVKQHDRIRQEVLPKN